MWWYTNEPVRCSKNDIYYHTTVVSIRVTCIYKQVNWPSIDVMNINIMDKKKALSDIAEGQIFGRLRQSISQWLSLWDIYIKVVYIVVDDYQYKSEVKKPQATEKALGGQNLFIWELKIISPAKCEPTDWLLKHKLQIDLINM